MYKKGKERVANVFGSKIFQNGKEAILDIYCTKSKLSREEIAEKMKEGIVKGISTQRPYEQGQAAGRVLAKSLVSEDIPKYIAVQPYLIRENQLKQAWQNIFFEKLPMELE